MLELYQAEWCPHSHAVRTRLTELGVDFVARQVPAEPDDRDELRERSGESSIPLLVLDDGQTLQGEERILAWLDGAFVEGPEAEAHRRKERGEAWLQG